MTVGDHRETPAPASLTGSSLRFVAQHSGGQQKYGFQQLKERVESDADQAERQRDQPHEWPQDQREQGQRPADDQQDEPTDESEDGCAPPGIRPSRMTRISWKPPFH